MIRLKVGNETISLPPALIAQIARAGIPKWLTGEAPADGAQRPIKAAVKGALHLLLGYATPRVPKGFAPIDTRCPAARENIVLYALAYLTGNATRLLDGETFAVEGERDADGTLILSGLAAPDAEISGEAKPDGIDVASARLALAGPGETRGD